MPQLGLFGKRLASADTRRYKRVRPGDFVYDPNLLWSGAIARSHLDHEGIVSPVYEVFRVGTDVDARFVETWLRSPERIADYRRISDGTNVRRRRAAFTELEQLSVDLPPKAEQLAIAAVLDAIDDAIEHTNAVIAAIESLRQAVLHELVTRGVPGWHTDWTSAPGIGALPVDWRASTLGALCEPPEYGASAPSIEYDPGLPRYVRITDIEEGGRLRTDGRRSAEPQVVRGYELRDGDLLFARSGATVGKTYLHRPENGNCVFAGYLVRFRALHAYAYPDFLALWTSTRAYARWVERTLHTGAQPNISATEYATLPVPCPPLAEQGRIVRVVRGIDVRAELEAARLRALRHFAFAIAGALLSGRIRTPRRGLHALGDA